MLKRLKYLRLGRVRGQSGDTIVEVLIVLAVLSLAFSLSYATANRGLSQSRNAAEHSEALGILNTQVELVRTALAKQVTLPVGTTPPAGNTSLNFCMADTTNPPSIAGFGAYTVPNSPAADNAIDNTPPQPVYPAACVNGFYHTSIVYDTATGSYDFRVRWDGSGRLGRQQEEFNYKITPIAAAAGFSGDPILQTPAVNVVVQSINLTGPAGGPANPTPSCSSTNVSNKSGTQVTLTGPTGSQTLVTDASSSALFNDLLDGGTYTASVFRSGYGTCPGASTAVASTPTPSVITRKIYPICQPHTTFSGYWSYDNRRADLDGYYYTIPPAVPNGTYPGAFSSFVVGNVHAPGNFIYQWSGDSSRAGQGLLYYWLWETHWVNTSTTTYTCPS
jgi:type II secretory pathway pseudopilin PulG